MKSSNLRQQGSLLRTRQKKTYTCTIRNQRCFDKDWKGRFQAHERHVDYLAFRCAILFGFFFSFVNPHDTFTYSECICAMKFLRYEYSQLSRPSIILIRKIYYNRIIDLSMTRLTDNRLR